MPNLKFSQFDTETTTTSVTGIVGYNTTANKNIQITPTNFINTTGGPYLPLAGGTMTGVAGVVFPDDFKLNLGTSSDLQIYHNGTNSTVNNLTGDLYIMNTSNDKDILFLSDDGSGGVATYFFLDGSNERLQVDAPNGMLFSDNIQAKFGNGSDLQIYHDGSNSRIYNDTGDLYIRNQADDKDIYFQSDNGSGSVATYFYLDGGGTLTRFEKILRMQDNVSFQAGSSGDFVIRHNGTDSYLENETGDLYIKQNKSDADIIFQSDDGSGGETTYLTLDGSTTNAYFSNPGNVGIGTTSPAYKLAVYGSSTDSEIVASFGSANDVNEYTAIGLSGFIAGNDATKAGLALERTASFGTGKLHFLNNSTVDDSNMTLSDSRMVIDADGNVGIGTTSPTNNLQVTSSGNSQVLVERASGAAVLIQAQSTVGVVGTNTNSRLDLKSNGTTRMTIATSGDVGIGTATPGVELDVNGQIRSNDSFLLQSGATAIGSIRNEGGALDIRGDSTRDVSLGSVTSPQALFIEGSNGNVGIGTTIPAGRLHVKASNSGATTEVNGTLIVEAGSSPAIQILSANSQTQQIKFGDPQDGDAGAIIYSHADNEMNLKTNAANRLTIDSSGNVGIGTTSPASKLEVDGGDIEIDDSASGLILRSPDGTRYRVTVADGGAISASAV